MKYKTNITFYIQDNSVRLYYNKQCVVFNTYNCESRHKFNRFKETIANSPKKDFDNINDIYRLARICEVRGTGGRYDITIHKNVAY